MKKFAVLIVTGFLLLTGSFVSGHDVVFQHPSEASKIFVPEYKKVSCTFSQTKTIPNSKAYIKSGGNFKLNANSGVVFETLYPVKTTTEYTKGQNKHITDIITAVSRKDYSYLNRNFDLFYLKNGVNWTLALKPKSSSKAGAVMENIIITGSNYISTIEINTLKSGSTKINFTGCKSL